MPRRSRRPRAATPSATPCSGRSARPRRTWASLPILPRRGRSPDVSPRSSLANRVARIPVWAWLTAIVVGSAIFRAVVGRGIVAPFIMVDEVIWSEIARGIADAGEPLLRDQPDPGYSVVYPLLISPVYVLFKGLPSAYEAVKVVECGRDVARRGARVLPGAASRRRRPLAAGGAPRRRAPVARVHGDRDDGEPLLPALPRLRARPRARARAADRAADGAALRPARRRVRHARPGDRPRAGDPARAAPARDLRPSRRSRDLLALPSAVRGVRGPRAPGDRRAARRRDARSTTCWVRMRPWERRATASEKSWSSSSGTSRSSRCTCSSCPSPPRSSSWDGRGRSTTGSRRSSRRRSRSRSASSPWSRRSRLTSPIASRSGISSTSRRCSSSRSWRGWSVEHRDHACSLLSRRRYPRSSSCSSRSTASSRPPRSRTR